MREPRFFVGWVSDGSLRLLGKPAGMNWAVRARSYYANGESAPLHAARIVRVWESRAAAQAQVDGMNELDERSPLASGQGAAE